MTVFDEMLPRAMTAFYLPLPAKHGEYIHPVPFGTVEFARTLDALLAIPFPCIRIVREGEIPPGAPGWHGISRARSDCVCELVAGDFFAWGSKEVVKWPDGKIFTRYSPEDWADWRERPAADMHLPVQYIRLMEALGDRKHRFIERDRLTRQQRRAIGVTPEYREYIVINKRDAPAGAHTLSEIVRRHPILHAVRAHLRHYKSGLVTPVRAHARGHGQLFQVKDYKVQA